MTKAKKGTRMTPKDLAAHVRAEWAKGKSVKLTPQEWIEVSMAVGGFRPAPPPKPFLVKQRQRGVAQQLEFTFDVPQAVAPVRKRRRRETNGKNDGAA